MKGTYDVVLAGRGGQGVLFLARILGEAAMRQGLPVRTTETHGMAMRGGSVLCFLRVGHCLGPLFPRGTASLLMAISPSEAIIGAPFLAEGGTVAVNDNGSCDLAALPEGVRVLGVDADRLASEGGNTRSSNLALLGTATAGTEGFPLSVENLEEAIMGAGPARLRPANLDIFRRGLAEHRKAPWRR